MSDSRETIINEYSLIQQLNGIQQRFDTLRDDYVRVAREANNIPESSILKSIFLAKP